jgi:hypothetical protein
MKNKILFFALCLFGSSVFYNCHRSQTAQNQADTDSKTILYPNQDSELALLMREMDVDAQKMKESILAGKIPPDFREKFAKIHTAIPTDSTTKNEAFAAIAANFLQSLDKIYTAPDQIQAFNLMVNDCLNCHKMHCPGPIVRIKKLSIVK